MLECVVHRYPLLRVYDQHLLQQVPRVVGRQPGVRLGVVGEEVVGEEGGEGGSGLRVLILHVPPHRRLQPVDEALQCLKMKLFKNFVYTFKKI